MASFIALLGSILPVVSTIVEKVIPSIVILFNSKTNLATLCVVLFVGYFYMDGGEIPCQTQQYVPYHECMDARMERLKDLMEEFI
jgi:predicted PurR-regulated permease PerM